MAHLRIKRTVIYLVALSALLVAWGTGLAGIFPGAGSRTMEIFKPPKGKDVTYDVLDLDRAALPEVPDGVNPTVDPFEQELRRLAAESSGGGDDGDTDKTNPAPTVIPTATPEPTNGADRRAKDLAPDDGRNMFSGLTPQPTSQVTDILPGVVVRGPGGVPPVDATPTGTPTGRRWVGGQSRGYTMLYAMQPQARQVVEVNVQTLLGARIREPHIGVLIDGTFGRDFAYLKDVVTRLSADDRALTLTLYLSNGPTMRKWEVTPIDQHIFARISPEEFRLQIRRNMTLRAEFLAVVLQAKDVFTHNSNAGAGNSNVAIVMLEDNLEVLSYRALREIAAEQLGRMASFMRNPCIGCRTGNDDNTLGDPREEHQLERFGILKSGDAYSLDGIGFKYPNGEGTGPSSAQLVELIDESFRRGMRYFGLWQEEWQGVKKGIANKRPEDRTYVASSPDQQAFEVQMLRSGLIPEVADEDVNEGAASS